MRMGEQRVVVGAFALIEQCSGTRTGTPDQIREFVRQVAADGADLIKIFASGSIRTGGERTLSDEQIAAACGEAQALGLRSMVHAYGADVIEACARAGCTAVEHVTFATDETMKVVADNGTYFGLRGTSAGRVRDERREGVQKCAPLRSSPSVREKFFFDQNQLTAISSRRFSFASASFAKTLPSRLGPG